MFRNTNLLVAAALLALTAPAKAALVLDQSGPMSNLFRYYDSQYVATVGAFGIYGPQSNGNGVSFPIPPIFKANGEPNSPWFVQGQPMHYDILLTTPVPLIDARGAPGIADWYDIYNFFGGAWQYSGGNDNSGGYFMNCEGACPALSVAANTTRLSFDFRDSASWGEGFGGYVIDYRTYNFAQIAGELPVDALDGQYRLRVFASAIPEPATWAMLILGFGAIGGQLRRAARKARYLKIAR